MCTTYRTLTTAAARSARVAVVLLDPVYRLLKHSRVGGLLDSPPLRWLRRRVIPGMGPADVLDVLELLHRAGVPCWLVGGWGVDALVGRQTRRHSDVDVGLEWRFLEQAMRSLEGDGFVAVEQKALGVWMPWMVILRDVRPGAAGRERPPGGDALPLRSRLHHHGHRRRPHRSMPGRARSADLPHQLCAPRKRPARCASPHRALPAARSRRVLVIAPGPALTESSVARRLRRAAKAIGRRTGWLEPNTHTELSIPVRCTAPLRRSWRGRARRMVAADHITLLDPFIPSFLIDADVEEAVSQILLDFKPFSYELARVERFPGVLYLAPEPGEPFIAMTEALCRRFPNYPPYGGAHDAIVPHVTLALGPEPEGLAEHVQQHLPLRGSVEEVWLKMETPDGNWSAGRRFRLGSGSA
jgi:2'-5' RNA ligase